MSRVTRYRPLMQADAVLRSVLLPPSDAQANNNNIGRLRPPVPYFGSKAQISTQVADLLPAHRIYVEPFFGAGSLLLAKSPSPFEVVGDLDGDLMMFWQVLRDCPNELERAVCLTPHARGELESAKDSILRSRLPDTPAGQLERARRVYVALTQGRGGTLRPTGWRFYKSGSTSMARVLSGYSDRIAPVAARLSMVSLENRPAASLICDYDSTETLFVIDPPYPKSTRGGNRWRYNVEFAEDIEHENLAHNLAQISGNALVFSYPGSLYERLYAGWFRYELAASTTQGNQRRVNSSSRVEVLYSTIPLSAQDTLFDFSVASSRRAGSRGAE
jgi:DNA adenine methylase